jgi:hypothetical protein
MTQTLSLSVELYRKLAQGAAERGMTIESLLAVVSNLVAVPSGPTPQDRRRSRRIETLLERSRNGKLTVEDRRDLDALIEADYQAATALADELIRAKQRRSRNGHATKRTRK